MGGLDKNSRYGKLHNMSLQSSSKADAEEEEEEEKEKEKEKEEKGIGIDLGLGRRGTQEIDPFTHAPRANGEARGDLVLTSSPSSSSAAAAAAAIAAMVGVVHRSPSMDLEIGHDESKSSVDDDAAAARNAMAPERSSLFRVQAVDVLHDEKQGRLKSMETGASRIKYERRGKMKVALRSRGGMDHGNNRSVSATVARNPLAQKASSIWSSVSSLNCFRVKGINLHQTDFVPENEYTSGPRPGWEHVYQVVFESSTTNGQLFDVVIFIMICCSVLAAILDSINDVRQAYGSVLLVVEIIFTLIFSVEYFLRIVCIKDPREYLFSFMGIVDLSSIVPTYIAALAPSARPLLHLGVLRFLRILRVFRVLKLVRFVDEANALSQSMERNKHRIAVFTFTVFVLILVLGCAMYLIEGELSGFTSIPVSLYWTVVTLTTVGYGDITPKTILGRCLATFVMLAGYGIIACPLVLSSSSMHATSYFDEIECSRCFQDEHEKDANFCRICGNPLRQPDQRKSRRTLRT